jgi:hypothetical protein
VRPSGAQYPFPPTGPAAGDWSPVGVGILAAALVGGWALARRRLARRLAPSPSETLAGYVAALVWLGGLSVVVAAARPYAVLFLLPSLYAWLWLPRASSHVARMALFALGLSGPVGGVLVLAGSLGTSVSDVARYLVELAGIGYIGPSTVLLALAWTAAAAQLGALALGRYAPYAAGQEPPPPGLVRTSVARAARRRAGTSQASGM